MERVAETYKAKFVVSTSEHGEEDLLLLNVSSQALSLCLLSSTLVDLNKKVLISFVQTVYE